MSIFDVIWENLHVFDFSISLFSSDFSNISDSCVSELLNMQKDSLHLSLLFPCVCGVMVFCFVVVFA